MIILEDVCTEITSRQYIDFVIKEEKTIQIYRSLAICRNVFCSNQITRKGQKDVLMQNVQINYYSYTERKKEQNSSLYRGCKLLLSEDKFEVVRIDYSVASILPFRIDVPLSSESIQFGAKMTRIEPDDKIVLRKVLRLLHLSLGVRRGSHGGGSPQNGLRDEQTCGMTLALAYVLCHLSAVWSQLQMKKRKSKWK